MRILDFEFAPQFAAVRDSQTNAQRSRAIHVHTHTQAQARTHAQSRVTWASAVRVGAAAAAGSARQRCCVCRRRNRGTCALRPGWDGTSTRAGVLTGTQRAPELRRDSGKCEPAGAVPLATARLISALSLDEPAAKRSKRTTAIYRDRVSGRGTYRSHSSGGVQLCVRAHGQLRVRRVPRLGSVARLLPRVATRCCPRPLAFPLIALLRRSVGRSLAAQRRSPTLPWRHTAGAANALSLSHSCLARSVCRSPLLSPLSPERRLSLPHATARFASGIPRPVLDGTLW